MAEYVSKYKTGPTGRISTGHVLDVARAPLQRMLSDYDNQLYVKWNGRKLGGWGCWELRRRPNKKSIKDVIEHEGSSFVVVDYVENDFESHILDLPYLNYEVMLRLKAMDTWSENLAYYVDRLESAERTHQEEQKLKNYAEMRYHARQEMKAIRDYREAIRSGMNPAEIVKFWK